MSSQDELDYKRALAERLRVRGWHVQEHEDRQSLFIPDLSIAQGGFEMWIEVKYRRELPPTLHSMKHWTAGQQKWLEDRGRAGAGNCCLLLGVPGHHYLWRWPHLSTVRHLPFHLAVDNCYLHSVGSPDVIACDLWNQYGAGLAPRS